MQTPRPVREHHAPVGALRRMERTPVVPPRARVREHHTPVGALRRVEDEHGGVLSCQEGYSGAVLKTWSVKVVVTVRSSGRFPAQPHSAPDGRLAWWDGVSHVVTRPAREHVTQPARSSLNPRARHSGRRARGLSDDLADRGARRRRAPDAETCTSHSRTTIGPP